MNEHERFEILQQIAKQDDIVILRQKTRETLAPQFEAFANTQPQEIRNILWGYAESGRLVYQRMVNLACLHMDFAKDLSEE